MNSKRALYLDWCDYSAARYAVEHWHYSRRMPSGKLATIGVWERGDFIGAVVWGSGAAPQAACPYSLERREVAELVRVALSEHVSAVSKIISVAVRMVKRLSPGLRLLVSYADPAQGHTGVVYQAANWIYEGRTVPCEHFEVVATGRPIHSKTLKTGRRGYATQLLRSGHIRSVKSWKHKYLMPLDKQTRKAISVRAASYPKRGGSYTDEASGSQPEEGGLTPTPPLQQQAAP